MNVINFQIDKKRNNFSKNRQKAKQFLLPSLNIMLKEDRHKKTNMPYQYEIYNLNKNKQIKNINNQFKNQKNKIKNKSNEHHQVFRNHKPYSGNPSIKCNSNIVEVNKPIENNNQMNFEREILTANPSLVASKIGFNNNYENNSQFVNNRIINNKNQNPNKNNIILTKNNSNIISNNLYSDLNKYKESNRENISAKYQYNQDKEHRIYKKMMGVSKSSPRFSSLGVISRPYEIQKQKENIDYKNNLKVIMSYNNDNCNSNFYNNMMKMKNNPNMNPNINFVDYKNFNEYNKYLTKEKNKQFNLGNIYSSQNSNLNTQNMLIKAAEKVKLQLVQKHLNLKSASIINISNPIHGEYPNNNNIKIIKNKSKHSLNSSLNTHKDQNILGGLNNTAFSTISPYSASINNNLNQNNLNDINNNNKPKISKCFISYAYNEHPNLDHRQEMEDFHCIKQALGKNPYISYFSIFDGHGGKEVSSYLSLNFHRILIKEINSINFSTNDDDDENIKNIMNAIKNAFEKIDKEILKNNNISNDVGSTATIIIIYCNENEKNEKKVYDRTLICANVGDSNGFLINKNYIKLITKGHKCEDPSEVKRIKDQGGIVFQGRIFGKLILTRTLGDKEMKKYGVVPIPDFFCKKISNDDLFVIIGSDGVWDIIEENEIYQIGIEKGLSSEEFSKKLINISKERDTRDNSSCIVVKLNKNI